MPSYKTIRHDNTFSQRKSGKIVQIGYQPSNGKALQANTKIQKIKYSEGKFQSGGHS